MFKAAEQNLEAILIIDQGRSYYLNRFHLSELLFIATGLCIFVNAIPFY